MARGRPFRPGSDGRRNAGGRPKVIGHVQELARAHTETAMRTLVEIAQDAGAPPPARVAASTALLDRGWGKPTQPVDGDGQGGAIKHVVTWEDGS